MANIGEPTKLWEIEPEKEPVFQPEPLFEPLPLPQEVPVHA